MWLDLIVRKGDRPIMINLDRCYRIHIEYPGHRYEIHYCEGAHDTCFECFDTLKEATDRYRQVRELLGIFYKL